MPLEVTQHCICNYSAVDLAQWECHSAAYYVYVIWLTVYGNTCLAPLKKVNFL
jgi:hypothetical protein